MAKNPFKQTAAAQRERNVTEAAQDDRFDFASKLLASAPSNLVDPDQVTPRKESTRQLDPAHVEALQQSIAALGLIEPIVVDRNHRLLAGGHRLAAVQQLRTADPEQYDQWFADGIPVRTLDFDAEEDAESERRALQIEIAENEHRRDYTRTEVQALADRLRAAGYRDTVGRPKKGEKSLGPALQVIIGKSAPTIRKILAGDSNTPPAAPKPPAHPLTELERALHKHQTAVPEALRALYDQLLEAVGKEIAGG